MSDKGQRIYKWIVWILLIVFLCFSFYRWIDNLKNPDITKTEWMTMLDSKIDRDYVEGYGDEPVTGKDIALSSMNALGEKRLEYLVDGDLTDESLLELADEINVVKKNELNKTYSKEEAEEVLTELLDYYSNPETYPVYDKTVYLENVVDTKGWSIDSVDYQTGRVQLTSNGKKIEPGQILLIENEYGLSDARKVVSCEQGTSENEYVLMVENISSPSELASHYSFSGFADFSYLDNFKVDNQQATLNNVEYVEEQNSSLFSISPMTVYAADINASTNKTTLEFGIAFDRKEVNHQPQDSVKFTVSKDGTELELGVPIDPEVTTPDYNHNSQEVSLAGTVTIEDLCIVASGEWNPLDFDDKNNTVAVTVNSNVIFDIAVEGEFTGNFPLKPIPLPIRVGPGGSIFSVELQPVLVVGVGGELAIEWKINNIKKGIEYVPTCSTPLVWVNEGDDPVVDFDASVYLEGGIEIQANAYILKDVHAPIIGDCTIKLADPAIEIKTAIKAETQGINPGFEEYPPCVDIGLFLPLVKIEAAASMENGGELSALATVLEKLEVSASKELMTEENAIVKINRHYEFEKDGTINKPLSGMADDVCTHVLVEEEDIIGDIEETVDDAVDEAEDALRKKIEAEIERILEQILLDNCNC